MAESSEQMGLTDSDKCTANTGPSPHCVPLAHVRWNLKWCCFLWRRLICPQNSSLRMFWYRDLNSSHFFPRFDLLEHEANRTPDISATFISSRKKFCKRNRMSVCPARKGKPSSLSVSYRLNRFNRCSRGRTRPLQILCQNMVRAWYDHGSGDVFTNFRMISHWPKLIWDDFHSH